MNIYTYRYLSIIRHYQKISKESVPILAQDHSDTFSDVLEIASEDGER